jgi:Raf kinase inhibitor-like YbhB/YbcL family protein
VRRGDHHSRNWTLGAQTLGARSFATRSFATRSFATRTFAALLLPAASLLLSGCALFSGPKPLSADAPQTIVVTSPDVSKDVLGMAYTCHAGKPMSPSVSWSGGPRAKSYALVIDDSDAPITPVVYWLVFDIGSDTTYIQPGSIPPGARVAYNSVGEASYNPPCPRGGPHKYRISVYALNTGLANLLPSRPQLLSTWTTIATHVIARGEFTVTACPQSPCRAESSK